MPACANMTWMEVAGVDVRQRSEVEIPGVRVVDLELEIRIRILFRLLQDRVFEGIALTERTVAVHVVVHPLIDRRGLLRNRLECRMRMEQCQRGREAVVRHAVDADLAVVVWNVLY